MWILTNRKLPERKGRVQLIDGSGFWRTMRKILGSKRKELAEEHIAEIARLFGACVEAQVATVIDAQGKETRVVVREGKAPPVAPEGGKVRLAPLSRILPNTAFGYRTITVERPLKDETRPRSASTKARTRAGLVLRAVARCLLAVEHDRFCGVKHGLVIICQDVMYRDRNRIGRAGDDRTLGIEAFAIELHRRGRR